MIVIYWWARQYPLTDTAEEAKISLPSACAMHEWLRTDVRSANLLQQPRAW